jgi:hypothetical protein
MSTFVFIANVLCPYSVVIIDLFTMCGFKEKEKEEEDNVTRQ